MFGGIEGKDVWWNRRKVGFLRFHDYFYELL